MSVVKRQPDPSVNQNAALVSLAVFIVLLVAITVQAGVQGRSSTIVAWIAGSITILLAAAFAWIWVKRRRGLRARALRLAAENSPHSGAMEQLPLTPEVSAYLHKEAEGAAHPVNTTLVILAMFSVIPAFFTVLFVIRGVAFDLFTVFMWAGFLGFGALVSAGVLHDLRQERRDLIGGVFDRATGSFSIKLIQNKYGTSVQVVVGGRSLKPETAPALNAIESFTGTVDYLPVSGDLLEVRDESGQTLWRRFANAAPAVVAQSAAT